MGAKNAKRLGVGAAGPGDAAMDVLLNKNTPLGLVGGGALSAAIGGFAGGGVYVLLASGSGSGTGRVLRLTRASTQSTAMFVIAALLLAGSLAMVFALHSAVDKAVAK